MSAKNPLFLLGLAASLLVGIFLGSSAFTFVSAQGTSYLTDDPNVCVNCHVMREQYDGWRHGSRYGFALIHIRRSVRPILNSRQCDIPLLQ